MPAMADVKVEQCDRDAAAAMMEAYQDRLTPEDQASSAALCVNIRAGLHDGAPRVQAFARHRQAAEKAQQERGFNVNENVWVNLTDEGRAYHRRWYAARYPMLPYRVPYESNDGWSKWQLWSLMQQFGDAIHMGGHVPFETTIRLTDPATAIRSQGHE